MVVANDQLKKIEGQHGNLVERLQLSVKRRSLLSLDTLLLALLLGNLSLLLLSTMPRNYFFGLKVGVLRVLARSLIYRAYVRAWPIGVLACSGLAIASRISNSTASQSKVFRSQGLALANVLLAYIQSRLYELIRGNPEPVLQLEARAEDREVLSWEPPSPRALGFLTRLQRHIMPAVLFGAELLPVQRDRLLFVGNHGIWGLDVSVLLYMLYTKENIFPRSFGSHAWFAAPVLNEFIRTIIGAVDGTEHNCDILMQAGHNCLVYPGGEREAWKKLSDKKYALIWGESRGFARMALRHQYTIIPVASVGTEDVFEAVADFPLSKFLRFGGMIPAQTSKKVGGNALMEGSTLPLIIPQVGKLQRQYFKLGKPIKALPSEFIGGDGVQRVASDPRGPRSGSLRRPGLERFEPTEEDVCALRDRVREAIQSEVEWLLAYREADPDRFVPPQQRRKPTASDERSRL